MIWGLLFLAADLATPVAPSPSPVLPPVSSCLDAARRDAILSGKAFPLPSTDAINAYNEKRSAALDARMTGLGLDPKEKSDFALRVMKSPEFSTAFRAGMAGLTAMMKDLGQMARSKDPAANCRLLLHMAGELHGMIAGAERQWQIMDRELDAEEKRRAVGKPS